MNARAICLILLVASASHARGQEPVPEHVTKLDLLAALRPEGIIQVRELRSQGSLHLCAANQAIQARVERGEASTDSPCAQIPIERVDREGSFPHVDATIDATMYPANEAHLLRRGGLWFVFLEGGHDESVISRHFGTVFLVSSGSLTEQPSLTVTCAGQREAYDTDVLYLCIANDLPPLDLQLIAWTGERSCSIDYSVCL